MMIFNAYGPVYDGEPIYAANNIIYTYNPISIIEPAVIEYIYDPLYDPHTITLYKYNIDDVECTFNSGATNRSISIIENNASKDPTYDEMMAFIHWDETDKLKYTDNFKCAEFGTTIHDKAEWYGIKAHIVILIFSDGSGHLLNAFNTTDQGLIYVDCTGTVNGGNNHDRINITIIPGKIISEYGNDVIVNRLFIV